MTGTRVRMEETAGTTTEGCGGDAAEIWSAVADAWEEEVDDVDDHSAPATEALFARLDVRPGDAVLEVAAGPGSLAGRWAEAVGPDGSVVLSDVAPAMAAAAARRTAGLPNVSAEVLDATAIDRPENAFDVVAARMGLMFVPDVAVALAEIRRVLRPGGRFGSLSWGTIDHNPWMTCVGMAGMIHGVLTGGPPAGPGTIFSLGNPQELQRALTDAGFDDVSTQVIDITFRVPDIGRHVARVSSLAGPMAAQFAEATDEQLAAVRATAAEIAAPYATDDGYAIPGRTVLVSGRV